VNARLSSGLVLLVVAAVVAGCGGEGDSTTTTATPTVASSTSTTPAPAPRGSGAEAFQAYVDETTPTLAPVMRQDGSVAQVQDAFQGLSQKPDDSWDEAAQATEKIGNQMAETAVAMQQVAPPRDMVTEHKALISAYQASAKSFQAITAALRDHDVSALKAALGGDSSATQPSEWVTAMGTHSETLNVPLPDWLDQYVTLLG
jgi:hypothetical protein